MQIPPLDNSQVAYVGSMGDLDCQLKPTLALKPEARLKWLTRAVAALKDGSVRVSDVFDIISHPKFVNGVPDGVGKKMRRSLSSELGRFSDKQRQGLEKSELFKRFPDEAPKGSKSKPAEVDEGKMDDMMARCRGFVRENEGLWEVRKRELEEAEERKVREEEDRQRAIEEEKQRTVTDKHKHEDNRLAAEKKRKKEAAPKERSDSEPDEEENPPATEEVLARLERALNDAEAERALVGNDGLGDSRSGSHSSSGSCSSRSRSRSRSRQQNQQTRLRH